MARAVLEIVLDSKGNVTAIKQAGKDLEGLGKEGTASAGAMERLTKVAGFVGGAIAAIKSAEAALEFVELGASVDAAEDRFAAFAGGTAEAAAHLGAFQAATDGTVDRMSAMESATKLLGMGLVDSADEMGLMAEMATKLGDQTMDAGDRVNDFALLLANQSVQRLDNFNISSGETRKLIDELLHSGQALSRDEAFKMAVMEIGAESLEKLGDQSELLTTKIGKVKAAVIDAKTGFAELAVEALAGAGGVDDLAERVRGLPVALKQVAQLSKAAWAGLDAWRPWDMAAGMDAFNNSLKRSVAAEQDFRVASEETRYAHLTGLPTYEREAEMLEALNTIREDNTTGMAYYAAVNGTMQASVSAGVDAFSQYQAALGLQAGYDETAMLSAQALAAAERDAVVATEARTQSQLDLAQSLMGASDAQIAQAAIGALGQELAEGDITMEEYAEAVGQTQLAFGLADEASVNLSKRLIELAADVGDGQVSVEDYDEAVGELIAIHDTEEQQLDKFGRLLGDTEGDLYGAERATDALGREIEALPDEKRIRIVVEYDQIGTPPAGMPSNVPTGMSMGSVNRSWLGDVGGRSVPVGGLGMGAGSGARGQVAPSVTIINHFGRGSVRSQSDIEEITRLQERQGTLRGVRLWEM